MLRMFNKPIFKKFIVLSVMSLLCFNSPLFGQAKEEAEVTEPEKTAGEGLGIHGFFNVIFTNDYITPRGLLVTNSDLTVQIFHGFGLDVYKNPDTCGINSVSFTLGTIYDFWTGQDNSFVGAWNEFDWFFGTVIGFGKHWRFGLQYVQFLSPPHNFRPENNVEFLLGYDDSWLKLPVVFNPYVKLWWTVSGDSNVVVGRRGHTYDVEIGFIPTMALGKCYYDIVLTTPTWITVGPASFWNGGEFGLKHEPSNFGVFSTGLTATIPLKWVPKPLGKWYVNGGFQYYYLINNSLLEAQVFTLGVHSRRDAHRNVMTGFVTIGVNW